MKLYQMVFSATGRTQAVANLITSAWHRERIRMDLSLPGGVSHPEPFTADDVCLVVVPVYRGRVPAPAVENLRRLRGNGAQAVLVAVYGNRAVDDCLRELEDILTQQGFRCRAAIAAVAEHSMWPQFAAGRPDAADQAQLLRFADQIRNRLEADDLPQQVSVPGNAEYVEMGSGDLFPQADQSCTKCGLCAQKCPMGAIPAADPSVTDTSRCITCMRCVAICPQQARSLPAQLRDAAAARISSRFEGRKENVLYLT